MLRAACLLSSLLFSMSAFAATGERWEYSNQMNMPGMNLPARTTKVCKEAGWEKPPQDAQKSDCQMGEFRRSGNTMTWSMKCPQGNAHGQMTLQGNDSFTGTTVFEGEQGKFTMNMTGRRIGSCEIGAGEGIQVEGAPSKAQIAQMQAQGAQMQQQAEAGQRQACEQGVQEMSVMTFKYSTMCASQKPAFCARMGTADGAYKLAKQETNPSVSPMGEAIAMCGGTREAIIATSCQGAVTAKDYGYITERCPAEATALAQQNCAGRDYTAISQSGYGQLCSKYAANKLSSEQSKQGQPAQNGEETPMQQGIKQLKNIYKW